MDADTWDGDVGAGLDDGAGVRRRVQEAEEPILCMVCCISAGRPFGSTYVSGDCKGDS